MTAVANTTQTPLPQVVHTQRRSFDLAERVATVALGILASAVIIAYVPPPISIFLAMVITIITLADAISIDEPTCYSKNVQVVEREVPVIVDPPIRRVSRFYDPSPRTLYIEKPAMPIFIPYPPRRHVEVVAPPDPTIREPVGRREERSFSAGPVFHASPCAFHAAPVQDDFHLDREPVGIRRRG